MMLSRPEEQVPPHLSRDGLDTVGGYQLQPGSPCLDAGATIPNNGGRDFFGNPAPAQAPPAIGAHQPPR